MQRASQQCDAVVVARERIVRNCREALMQRCEPAERTLHGQRRRLLQQLPAQATRCAAEFEQLVTHGRSEPPATLAQAVALAIQLGGRAGCKQPLAEPVELL